MRWTVLLLILPLLISCAPIERISECKNTPRPDNPLRAWCVIDGDTFKLANGRSVRLIGINSPEANQIGSLSAKRKLQDLVLGADIRLEKDTSELDPYGRLLRYVYVDNMSVNEEMIKTGWAKADIFAPDTKMHKEFSQAQDEAIDAKLGIWGSLENGDVIK